VGRIGARYLAARFPNPPVRTVRAAFTAHGSRKREIYRMFLFSSTPWTSPWSACAFVDYLYTPSRPSSSGPSSCTRLSRAQATMPYRTPHAALEFRWALACLLPTLLRIRHEVSRVPYGGLKQDEVGGALSTVPSALCGSPDGAWGKSRFTHALFHRAYGITQCRASCCRHDSFSWSGWHHRQGMPGS
jgi:hypothetical protein